MPRIALATYRGLPELSQDDRIVLEPLRRRGVDARPQVWDVTSANWARYDAVVVRSCWDYHLRHRQFTEWIARVEESKTPLWNPPPVLRWNLEKSYLQDLANAGIAVLSTTWVGQGEEVSLKTLLAARGWQEAVIKPTISASAFQTWRTDQRAAAAHQQRFADQLRGSDLMVQELAPEILTSGELSLVFFLGVYSHAVRKRPASGGFQVQVEHGGVVEPTEPPPDLIFQARQALEVAPGATLYARVDAIERGGRLTVMELELVEPDLFLTLGRGAAERFADAIQSRLG